MTLETGRRDKASSARERKVSNTDQSTKLGDAGESVRDRSVENEEPIASLRSLRIQVEIAAITSALQRTGWNRKQAARLLRISYRGLLYKIQRHHIVPAQHS